MNSIGIAVIGAGMAGKAHAAAYRAASTLYDGVLPPVRLTTIADVYEPLAQETARRFGYARHDTSWQAVAQASDVDVVSVVVANALHREIVDAMLAAGKHVLSEKPLSDSLTDARNMVASARAASTVARVGLTFRRAPGFAFIRDLVRAGTLGHIAHVSGRYWTDYGCDPQAPISWRYRGPVGSGALADVGSHLSYLAEFVGDGLFTEVRGGALSTVITSRPRPLGVVVGHEHAAVSTEREPVGNDDFASFSGMLSNGATATLQMSRMAAGHPNTLTVEVFGENGAASFDFRNPGQVRLYTNDGPHATAGYRTIVLGPDHPYWRGGLPMDAQGVGIGQNEGFVFQARAFLEEVAGVPESDSLPRNAGFDEGLHNMLLLDAVARSARHDGAAVAVAE